MNKTEAIKQALDFLMTRRMGAELVIDALQEALAEQPAQHAPVAYWIPKAEQFCIADPSGRPFAKAWEPLHASPPAQRTWVGLTDEEITDMWAESSPYYHEDDFARAIEAKLKEKNNG